MHTIQLCNISHCQRRNASCFNIRSDRVGVGQNAVKLSFTILAAALSLNVSRASSHRSKTDNRFGYNGEELFSATMSSVATGLKEPFANPVHPLLAAYRSLLAILRRLLLNISAAGLRHWCSSGAFRYYKTINIARITSCGNVEALNITVLVTFCLHPTAHGNIYAVDT